MNKKTNDLLYQISAISILVAAVLYLSYPNIASYVMIVGVTAFAVMTFLNRYPGKGMRGKRLFNIQVFAVLLMVVSAFLMFVHIKEWVIPLFISGILTFYSSVMLSRAYKKENEENQKK